MNETTLLKFERIKYPDGQISAKYEGSQPMYQMGNMVIKERINSYEDLFFVRSIADIINSTYHVHAFKLFIPCMFGQRSDKRFSTLQSFDLKLICDVINECNFAKVQIFDPHSDVCLALIKNSEKVSSFEYVKEALYDISTRQMIRAGIYNSDQLVLISPDAGAYKKVFEYGKNLNVPVMAGVKHRSLDGTVNLTFTGGVHGKDCLIVDDLCDGGYTFEVLAKGLKEHGANKVYLYVSHGLFSKGFVDLVSCIDHIYCTNSIKEIGPDVAKKFRTSADMYPEDAIELDYVTQFRII